VKVYFFAQLSVSLEMLRQTLSPARWDVEMMSGNMVSAESMALVGKKDPAVVSIGALPPGGLAPHSLPVQATAVAIAARENRRRALGTKATANFSRSDWRMSLTGLRSNWEANPFAVRF